MMKGAVALVLLLGAACCLVQARKGFGDGGQEWGYIDVRTGAHMFYWLYYVKGGQDPGGKPLVMWLQGGPGASSTSFGNFEEIGPLDLDLKVREKSWVNHANLLFVDNPVGTGFSYVSSRKKLTKNNKEIAADLVKLYLGFLQKNPKFKGVELYIFCESYGGKMTAEFAYELYKEKQRTNNADINLRGVALGDGWISGLDSTITWAPYLKQYNLLDSRGYATVDASAQRCKSAVEAGDWERATDEWGNTENVIMYTVPGFVSDNFYNIYGGKLHPNRASRHNVTVKSRLPLHRYAEHAVRLSESKVMKRVKKALGLPWTVSHEAQSNDVFNALYEDFMKPVIDVVEKLLIETPIEVNVFNGEWDLIVDIIGTLDWVNRLEWPGATNWKKQEQKPLLVEGEDNGYSQSYGNFTFYSISRAGHMVPSDNADAAIVMLRRITHLD